MTATTRGGSTKLRTSTVLSALAVATLSAGLFSGTSRAATLDRVPSAGLVQAGSSNGNWSDAEAVPNLVALNAGKNAMVNSVSCPSADNCSAAGQYEDGSGNTQAFVVDEVNGTWGAAAEVTGALNAGFNAGGFAVIMSVSSASAGNCSAGGQYQDGSSNFQAFVVDEVKGTWGDAAAVPGSIGLNTAGYAIVNSVSCPSAGNCTAGGQYQDGSFSEAFVADQVNGTWGDAAEVPGSATLNTGNAAITSVSCPSAGNCGAGGSYGASGTQAFVVNETAGIWGNAEEVPGSGTLNASGHTVVDSVSCVSAGNCSAGGSYLDANSFHQPFVVDEVNGSWGNATEVTGASGFNAGGSALVNSVSCASAGTCVAGGQYKDNSMHYQAFVVDETGGTWGDAIEVPNSATLNTNGISAVTSVSCASPGTCSAGGFYLGTVQEAFVVNETGGIWGDAEEAPNSGTLNVDGTAAVSSVSCASDGYCSAGGYYAHTGHQGFVANYTPLPTVKALLPASGPTAGGTVVTVEGGGLTGASAVLFGSKPGSHIDVVNADSLKVTAPAGTGTVDVTVTTPLGTSAASSKDHFTYAPRPTVTGLTPASGPVRGGTVVLVHGANLTGATRVLFGTKAGTHLYVVSAVEVKVTSPAGSGKVNVTVTTPGGSSAASSKDRFTYAPPPTVTGLTPTSGPVRGGTIVLVHGANLTGATRVLFGAKAGTHVLVVNAEEVKVTTPAGSGRVDVTVTTPGGKSAISVKARFVYALAPTVSGLSPTGGVATGGSVVTVRGTNLTGASVVLFGTKHGTHLVVVSADELKVTAPAGSGTVNVTVTTPGGTSAASAKDRFTYT